MTSASPDPTNFFSNIGNADATRRFIHDIAPAMSIDEGDHLTLATVSKGKKRTEATIGRLKRADEAGIIAFIQQEVTSRGEGRYKIRYTGARGRRNGSRTFTYPVEQKKRRVPVEAPTPPLQPQRLAARPAPSRRQSPPHRRAQPKPPEEILALETKVQELTTALTDLDSENSAVFQQLERERAARAEIKEELRTTERHLAETEDSLAEATATAQRVESQRAELEQERNRLLDRVNLAEATTKQTETLCAEQATRLNKLKAKLRRATDEREDLSRQLAQEQARPRMPDQTTKLEALQRRLERTTSERERLKHSLTQHEQATAREIATCRKEIEMIEDDRLKLRARVLQLEKENERLQREIRSLEAENRAGADYIKQMRAERDQDEDDEGYIHYDFSDDDDEDY